MPRNSRSRVVSLDYFRGLMALAVMQFHCTRWYYGAEVAGPLGKIGFYPVVVFYLLSGMAMTLAYGHRCSTPQWTRGFLIKRFFRIVPLFWLVSAITTLRHFVASGFDPHYPGLLEPWDHFLNYSLLFSWVKPEAYIAVGAWSVGNFVIFYAMFPVLIRWAQRGKVWLGSLLLLTAIPYLGFTFFLLTPSRSMHDQWPLYIHPLNQAFLFVLGCALVLWIRPRKQPSKRLYGLMGLSALLFLVVPPLTRRIDYVTGFNRLGLTTLCVVLAALFLRQNFRLPEPFHTVGSTLSDISYSIYLWHPLIVLTLSHFLKPLGVPFGLYLLVCFSSTGVLALMSYHFLEKPGMEKGLRLTRKLQRQPI